MVFVLRAIGVTALSILTILRQLSFFTYFQNIWKLFGTWREGKPRNKNKNQIRASITNEAPRGTLTIRVYLVWHRAMLPKRIVGRRTTRAHREDARAAARSRWTLDKTPLIVFEVVIPMSPNDLSHGLGTG